MKLDEFNKEKRKYFKCKKMSHIQRFCWSKENIFNIIKDNIKLIKKLKNKNVLKKKRSQNEKL